MISLLPLGLAGYHTYYNQKKIITDKVTVSHLELSNTLAHGIYENLEFTRRLLAAIGELEAVRNLNTAISEDFFDALMRHFSFFKLMYLVDSQRKIVASTDPDTLLPPDWLYSKAIKRSYQGSLSEVKSSPDGVPFMTLEAVIKSTEQLGITGVLISEVNLSSIRDLLRNALKNSKSQGLVFDETGEIIAKSSDDARSLSIPASEAMESDLTRLRDIDGEPYLITAVSLKKFDFYQAPNWTIVLQIPERIAFDAVYKFKERIITILSITAVISLLLAVFLARGFTAPLSNLIDGARHISSGDFEHRIIPMSSDEIGDLTTTFDEMRVNLRTTKADLDYRILQLSTLYEVGKAISSELDFRKLQNMILEIVVKVIKAEKGSLMMLDDAEKTLTIGVAIGLSEEIARDTRLEVGESVAGWVVKNRKPLFVDNVETDPIFQSIKKKNVRTGTLMSVPLTVKDKILGTLNISKSLPESFSDRDFELFINLANQAAIAIDNARLYRYAVTDEMTRLYNHRYFQQRLDEEIQRADRYENHVSLVILDVDHFKKFNDTFGHPEGDRVLKTVARLIEKNVREIDIPARYGGEEFVIICPEKNGEGSLTPAERIRTAIEGYDFRINGEHVPITVSLGVCCYPDAASSKADLIQKADAALYYSKENGRNRAALFNPIMNRKDA
ncbi:MAG TPA: diguanylate cyclase [Candidatus Rifleibacterium sp.]|nr:diguanylate cyclase [Candidatus Rifleibacterium sp.]HPT44386.1 diguanylate cyclase [Candidatus Rifleibacterium sp.]